MAEASQIPARPEEELLEVLKPSFFWLDEQVDPVTLFEFLGDTYQVDWIRWEPETLETTIEKQFNVDIPDIVWEKILAVRNVVMVDYFWEKWEVFEKVCLAFNSIKPQFKVMQYLSPAQIAYAVDCANNIRKHEFSDEVKGYVAAKLADEGIILPPPELSFCTEALDKLIGDAKSLRDAISKFDLSKGIKANDPACVQKLLLMSIEEYVKMKVSTREANRKKTE